MKFKNRSTTFFITLIVLIAILCTSITAVFAFTGTNLPADEETLFTETNTYACNGYDAATHKITYNMTQKLN